MGPKKDESDADKDYFYYLAQGKRHLAVNYVHSAVESLEKASSMCAEKYGETGIECADAYYYYGTALLELARVESGVIGGVKDELESNEGTEDEQEDEEEEENESAKPT